MVESKMYVLELYQKSIQNLSQWSCVVPRLSRFVYSAIFISILRRRTLYSGFGARSASLSKPGTLTILPGNLSGFSAIPGIRWSISLAIMFKKLFTW